MKIFIMRHGEAEHYARSDAERELTEHGRSASVAVAQACSKQGFKLFDKVVVSPYIRAQQTWQQVSTYFEAKSIESCDDITPYGDAQQVAEYVQAMFEIEQFESVLLISHLPLVGYLAAELVSDIQPPMFPTSGLICIDYSPEKRNGEVVFNIHP